MTRSSKSDYFLAIALTGALGIAWPLSFGEDKAEVSKDAETVARQSAVSLIEQSKSATAKASAPYLTSSIWKWSTDRHEINVKAYVDDQSGPYITIKTDDGFTYYWKRPSVPKTSVFPALNAK